MKKLFFITLALVITSVASAQIKPNEAGYCRDKPVGTSCTVPSSSSSYGEHGTNGNYSGQRGSCETTTSRASNSSTNQSSTSSTHNTGNSAGGNVNAEAKILGTGVGGQGGYQRTWGNSSSSTNGNSSSNSSGADVTRKSCVPYSVD